MALCCLLPVIICFADDKAEPYASAWRLQIDNDSMATIVEDRNYTGGITFSQSGQRAADRVYSLDPWLKNIDNLFSLGSKDEKGVRHARQFGLAVFTPETLSLKTPIQDDHPYSNLLFMANSRQRLSDDGSSVTRSMLLIGLLGTNTARAIQTGLHKLIDVDEASGWDNQISDGGELTFRYSLSRTRFLKTSYRSDQASYDISTTLAGNIGYTTDISSGISLRFGRIHSLGWHSLPEPSDHFTAAYAPLITRQGNQGTELFLITGLNLRLRAYNVLLQGQFRDSEVTYSYSALEPIIGEIWIGAGATYASGWRASFIIRARTREFDTNQADTQVWGSLTFSKVL